MEAFVDEAKARYEKVALEIIDLVIILKLEVSIMMLVLLI